MIGKCEEVPPKEWVRNFSAFLDLLVHAEGPPGTGRYRNVTVGVAEKMGN
jgi:hypothetical protein